ncbi:MAG: NUDIX hydrolase [Eubacteriaceae bacterium]|nr:NUDIX hydrolase [Eubacteriaceae bacterium]
MNLLDENGMDEQQFLAQYNQKEYPCPSVAVDTVAFAISEGSQDNYRKLPSKQLCLLLIQRAGHPHIGQWALPGGFVEPDETVGSAACRELEEETGVADSYIEQLFAFSTPGRDPRAWVISVAHMALVSSGKLEAIAGSDAQSAKWFVLNASSGNGQVALSLKAGDVELSATVALNGEQLEPEIIKNDGLAFDHAKIIAYALMRLRGELEYSDLAFNLMPEKFTLSELQQVYELLSGKRLLSAAFRRKVNSFVVQTGEYTQNAGHRPSQIYVRNKE